MLAHSGEDRAKHIRREYAGVGVVARAVIAVEKRQGADIGPLGPAYRDRIIKGCEIRSLSTKEQCSVIHGECSYPVGSGGGILGLRSIEDHVLKSLGNGVVVAEVFLLLRI